MNTSVRIHLVTPKIHTESSETRQGESSLPLSSITPEPPLGTWASLTNVRRIWKDVFAGGGKSMITHEHATVVLCAKTLDGGQKHLSALFTPFRSLLMGKVLKSVAFEQR